VHATLALSAPDGTGPPGLGQPETGYAWGRAQDRFEGSAGFGLQPYGPGGEGATGRRGRAPGLRAPSPPGGTGTPRRRAVRAREPDRHGAGPTPHSTLTFNPGQQVAGPAGRSSEPDDPGEEEPDDLGDQDPGDLGKREPGGFTL
jgi:hypothetical protein